MVRCRVGARERGIWWQRGEVRWEDCSALVGEDAFGNMATPEAMMAFGGSGADRDDEEGESGMIVYQGVYLRPVMMIA